MQPIWEVNSINVLFYYITDATSDQCLAKCMLMMFINLPFSRLCWEEIVMSLKSNISQEVLFTRWMVEQVILGYEHKKELLQMSSSEKLPELSTPLIFCSSSCHTLFWTYFQLTCILWKRVLNGNSGPLLFQKTTYVTYIIVKLYEQSPSHIQKHITDVFCSSAQILLLCGQIAITAIKGILYLNVAEGIY